jgi:signal transduction histidine kinase
MEQNIKNILSYHEGQIKTIKSDEIFRQDAHQLLDTSGFYNVAIVDTDGAQVFGLDLCEAIAENNGYSLLSAREAMRTASLAVGYSGTVWGVIWLGNREMNISAPIKSDGRIIGGIAVSFSLSSVYESVRQSEKLILFYILLDTLILAVVGIYLLSRIVVRPIHKLLKMTDEYRDGYIIPSALEFPRNEIGNLSRSLSYMLKRLEDNKQELKNHISSLQKANVELKQAQDEIIRSEKLASVGRLAAGIAHEIGNPIGIILGYLDLIRKGNVTEGEKTDFLNRVESEISRVKTIITQLLDYSRPSKSRQGIIYIHEIIKLTIDMLKPQPMMDNIDIVMDLKAETDSVFVDSNQIQQVFINIIMNAADVLAENEIEGRGKILHISSCSSGHEIEIRFRDNGTGIEKDELGHIFDPFYTTKEPGRGTGLGLSVSYRIIEEQGGTIRAESVKGEGMTIIIKLPLYDDSNTGKGVD